MCTVTWSFSFFHETQNGQNVQAAHFHLIKGDLYCQAAKTIITTSLMHYISSHWNHTTVKFWSTLKFAIQYNRNPIQWTLSLPFKGLVHPQIKILTLWKMFCPHNENQWGKKIYTTRWFTSAESTKWHFHLIVNTNVKIFQLFHSWTQTSAVCAVFRSTTQMFTSMLTSTLNGRLEFDSSIL